MTHDHGVYSTHCSNGVCAVFDGFDPNSTAYLVEKSHPSIYLAFPIIQDVVFDFIISIPPPHLQLPLLKHCVDNKVPSFLYLPMHILNTYTIDKAKSRLILYITGDHAWFVSNFNVKLFGGGGFFELAILN